jgi:threonine dehydratase
VNIRESVLAAERRIRGHVRETPVEDSPGLGTSAECHVYLKLENLQQTGSFKLRGATNKLHSLDPRDRSRGVVAASTGNHGMAVACAARSLSCPALIFVPDNAVESKVGAIRGFGAEIVRHGDDSVAAETAARSHALERGVTFVSPYNDPEVIAGQGTIARELERQIDGRIDAVFASLGGGGLISGVGGYLKTVHPEARVVACSPKNSRVMHESLRAGKILELASKRTLSDGTAGGVEPGAITFDLCREIVDDSIVVDEDEIRQALRLIIGQHHTLIEGAAAVAVAGFLAQKENYRGQKVAIVLCGANIDSGTLKSVL